MRSVNFATYLVTYSTSVGQARNYTFLILVKQASVAKEARTLNMPEYSLFHDIKLHITRAH